MALSELTDNFYKDQHGRRKSQRRSSILKSTRVRPFDDIQNTSYDDRVKDRRVSFSSNVLIKEFVKGSVTLTKSGGGNINTKRDSPEGNIQISTPKGNEKRHLEVRRPSIDRLSIIPKFEKSYLEDNDNEDFEPFCDDSPVVATPQLAGPVAGSQPPQATTPGVPASSSQLVGPVAGSQEASSTSGVVLPGSHEQCEDQVSLQAGSPTKQLPSHIRELLPTGQHISPESIAVLISSTHYGQSDMELTLDGSSAFSEVRCTNSSEPSDHHEGARNSPETNVDLGKPAVMSLTRSVVDQTAKDMQSVCTDKVNLLHRSGDGNKMLVYNTRMATEEDADNMIFTQIKGGVASVLSSWDDDMEITSNEDNKVVELSGIAAVDDDMEMTNIEDSRVTETCLVVASVSSDMEMIQGNTTGGSNLEPSVAMMQNATAEVVEMTRNSMDSDMFVEPSATVAMEMTQDAANDSSKVMDLYAMEMTQATDIGKVVDLSSMSVAMEVSQNTNTDNGNVVEPSAVSMEISQNTTNVVELSTNLATQGDVPTTSSKVVGPSASVVPVPTVTPVSKPPHGRPPRKYATSRNRRSMKFDKPSLCSDTAVVSVATPGVGGNVASVTAPKNFGDQVRSVGVKNYVANYVASVASPGVENNVVGVATPSVESNVVNGMKNSVVNVVTPGVVSTAKKIKNIVSVATSGSGRNGTSVRRSSSKICCREQSPKPLVHVPQRVLARGMGRGVMVSTPLSKRAGFVARHTPRFASNKVARASMMPSTLWHHQSCDMELVDSDTLLDATHIASPCVGGSPSSSHVDSRPMTQESLAEYTDGKLEQDLLKTSDNLEHVSPLSAATSTETDAVTNSALTLTSVDVSTQVAAANTGNEGNWLQAQTQDTSLVLVDSSINTGSAEDTCVVKVVTPEKTTRSRRKCVPFTRKRIPLSDSLIDNLIVEVNESVKVATPEMVQIEYQDISPAEHSSFASPEVTLQKRQSLMMSPSGFTKFLVNLNCDRTLNDHTFSADLESTTPAVCVELSTMGREREPCIVRKDWDSEKKRSRVEGEDEHCIVNSEHLTLQDSVCTGERVDVESTVIVHKEHTGISLSSPLALSGYATSPNQPHSHVPTGSPLPDQPLPSSTGAHVPSPNRSPSVRASSSDQSLSHLHANESAPPSSLYDETSTLLQSEVVFCSVSEAPSSPVIPAPSLHQISPKIPLSLMRAGAPVVQVQKPHNITCSSAFIMHVHSLRARYLAIAHSCQRRLSSRDYLQMNSHPLFKSLLESIITRANLGLSVLTLFISYGNISGFARVSGPIPPVPEMPRIELGKQEKYLWMEAVHNELEHKYSDIEATMVSAAEIFHWQVDRWNRSKVEITIHNSAKIALTLEESAMSTYPQRIKRTNVRYVRGSLLFSKPQTEACVTTADIGQILWTIIRYRGNS